MESISVRIVSSLLSTHYSQCYPSILDAIYNATGGQYNMTDDDPGLAAIFVPFPSAYLSTFGAIFDTVFLIAIKFD